MLSSPLGGYNSGFLRDDSGDLRFLCRCFNRDLWRCELIWHDLEGEHLIPGERLRLPSNNREHYEDARLFNHQSHWWVSYVQGLYEQKPFKAVQKVALLDRDGQCAREWTIPFGLNGKRSEKNWSFFSHDGRLHFVYSIAPHVVVEIDDSGKVVKEHRTNPPLMWRWGTMSGGSSPVRIQDETYGDCYLAFFHSYTWHATRHRRYTASAYLFSAEPPFPMIGISKPVLTASADDPWIENVSHPWWNPLVVFPTTAVLDDDESWLVSLGVNDTCDALVNMPHKKIQFYPVSEFQKPWTRYFSTVNSSFPVRIKDKVRHWQRIKGRDGVMAVSDPSIDDAFHGRKGVQEITEQEYNALLSGMPPRNDVLMIR